MTEAHAIEAILAVLLALPQWYLDRDDLPEAREALYRPVASSICRVGETPQEQAWLAAQAYAETKLARYVLEDRCSDGPQGARCDEGRATGPWQAHRHCTAAWNAPTAEGRLAAGARCALRTARHGLTVCGLQGAFGFQTGRRVCSGTWLEPRVQLYRWILSKKEAQR